MSFASKFPGFRLSVTRWGAVFLFAMLVLGVAAVNTGNNALMAILGLALGGFVVSGTWSRQVLGRVGVRVRLPREVFAGRPAPIEVELSNRSLLFPAYGLVLRDGAGEVVLVEWLLPSRGRRRRTVEVVFDDRGWIDLGTWRLDVLLPLGFFLKSKAVLSGERLLVYPRLLAGSARDGCHGGGARTEDVFDGRGREGEVSQLREFRGGDDLHQIHWKQTARQQRLIVVDRQRQADAPAYLVLDPRVADPEDPRVRESFERLVSEVAAEIVDRHRSGQAVGLVVGPVVIPPLQAPRGLGRLLRPLAEIEPLPADAAAPVRPGAGARATLRVAGTA